FKTGVADHRAGVLQIIAEAVQVGLAQFDIAAAAILQIRRILDELKIPKLLEQRGDLGLIFKRQINQHEGRAAFAVRELRIDDGRQDAGIEMMPVQADADICRREIDRKSTRLNSSHVKISYAVFCLKKKKKKVAIQNRK